MEVAVELESRHLRVIVLYADFVGSAETVKSLSPKERKHLYSTLLGEMAHVIEDFGGTVLKYVEECVVGFFVLPTAGWTQQIDRVLLCTEMMQKVMEHSVGPMVQLDGLPAMSCRIGIDCGDLQVARVRAEGIFTEVDVFGDVVNASKKICEEAESGEILMGKSLWQLLHASHRIRCRKRTGLEGDEETYDLYSLGHGQADVSSAINCPNV
jgi:class 3 adenylate cyclase